MSFNQQFLTEIRTLTGFKTVHMDISNLFFSYTLQEN